MSKAIVLGSAAALVLGALSANAHADIGNSDTYISPPVPSADTGQSDRAIGDEQQPPPSLGGREEKRDESEDRSRLGEAPDDADTDLDLQDPGDEDQAADGPEAEQADLD